VEFLIVLVVLAVVAVFVTRPLLRAPVAGPSSDLEPGEPGDFDAAPEPDRTSNTIAELDAARDAKYREILDAELDHRTGKLSDEDFEAIDQTLRAEAIEILHKLDRETGIDQEPGDAEMSADRDRGSEPQPPAGTP
jgi:hypothetical protein